MFSKKVLSVLFSGILAFSLVACSDSSDDESATPSAETQQMAGEINTAIAQAWTTGYAAAYTQAISKDISISKATQTELFSCSGIGWTASGSVTFDDVTVFPLLIGIDFTWNNFVSSANLTLVSGTCSIDAEMNSQTSMTLSIDGAFDVTYNSTPHEIAWHINSTVNGSSIAYSGTYTVDDVTYSYSGTAK